MNGTLRVNEVYGATVQGEGPHTGRRAAFLRLHGCNLTCVWCDTPFTWDWEGVTGTPWPRDAFTNMTQLEAVDRLLDLTGPGQLVVITGGEPLLQQTALLPLIEYLAIGGRSFDLETNGTITLRDGQRWHPLCVGGLVQLVCSPKLAHSGVAEYVRLVPEALQQMAALGAVFKFVLQAGPDSNVSGQITEVKGILQAAGNPSPARVWVQPEGITPLLQIGQAQRLAAPVLAQGWNLGMRQHVLLWGDERGR